MTPTLPVPLDAAALAESWGAAWSSLGCRPPAGVQAELLSAWSEPQRHYHDQQHLRECMALWNHWRHHAERPGEVALALWFHDAVYNPHSADNELRSAAWAVRALMSAGVKDAPAHRVHCMVMATGHVVAEVPRPSPDDQLLVDIDLSILGSPPERYARYAQDVRKEYAWVPMTRYREARTQVLQGFLERPRLYRTKPAAALLEGQARSNLGGELLRLAQ